MQAEPVSPPNARATTPRPVAAELSSEQALYQYLLAEIASQRGNPALAVRGMIDLAERSGDGRIARRAAEIAFAARQHPEARAALLTWLMIEPDQPAARQGLAMLLDATNTAGVSATPQNLTKWFATLGDWLTEARFAPVLLAEMPALLARFGEREAVYQGIRTLALQAKPGAEVQFAIAAAALPANRTSDALTAIDGALKLRPAWSRAALVKAQVLRAAQGETEARDYLHAYLQKHPVATEVRVAYARALVVAKDYPSAREQFRVAAAQRPDDIELTYAIGLVSQQVADFADAEVQYRRTLALKPRDPNPVYFNLATVAETKREVDAALGWYQQISSGDYFVAAQLKSATLLARRDGIQAGRDFLRAARDVAESNPALSQQMVLAEVQLLREVREFAEAHALLTGLIGKTPSADDFVYDRAMIAEKLGRLDDMETDLRRVITLKPDHAHAYNALGYSLAERGIRLDEAAVLIQTALRLAPDDAFIQDSWGWVLFKQGKSDDALAVLRRAYAARPDPEIAAHLGEVLWASGERDAALKLWRGALQDSPQNETLIAVVKRFQP